MSERVVPGVVRPAARVRTIVVWAVRVGLAVQFGAGGAGKVAGTEQMAGAAVTNVAVLGIAPTVPLVFGVLAAVVAYARRLQHLRGGRHV
jgi:hypothetical protein